MKKTFIVLTALISFGLGGLSALWMSGIIGNISANGPAKAALINVDGWVSDWTVGTKAADPYTRARIARHGLLALTKEEAVYFTRSTDNEGAPLTENCTYQLRGGNQQAFWWSITLYDRSSRLPMNEDGALSLDATATNKSKNWTAIIAPSRPEVDRGFWLSSRAAGAFDLTLRIYQPLEALLQNPEIILIPPSIEKITCAGEAI